MSNLSVTIVHDNVRVEYTDPDDPTLSYAATPPLDDAAPFRDTSLNQLASSWARQYPDVSRKEALAAAALTAHRVSHDRLFSYEEHVQDIIRRGPEAVIREEFIRRGFKPANPHTVYRKRTARHRKAIARSRSSLRKARVPVPKREKPGKRKVEPKLSSGNNSGVNQ